MWQGKCECGQHFSFVFYSELLEKMLPSGWTNQLFFAPVPPKPRCEGTPVYKSEFFGGTRLLDSQDAYPILDL